MFRENNMCTKNICKSIFTIPPNSGMFIFGNVTRRQMIGLPGVCFVHNLFSRNSLLLAKSVVTTHIDLTVPVTIMNPGDEALFVKRGSVMAHFKPVDNTFQITPVELTRPVVHVCANVTLPDQALVVTASDANERFLANFSYHNKLADCDKTSLVGCLCQNHDIFVTTEKSVISVTNVVEHQINLKPEPQSQHQRPYGRIDYHPAKRRYYIVRRQLDDLLCQHIIVPVNES